MTKGMNDWKNVYKKLSEHENPSDHINSILIFIKRSKIIGRIDTELEKQMKKNIGRKYLNVWKRQPNLFLHTLKRCMVKMKCFLVKLMVII